MIEPSDITIAVTVYNRREYLIQALTSALNQTVPVRVIVVEDCGPDPGLRKFVSDHFGDSVDYFRNPTRRGLFDNWNACIEFCRTPWLSILHDDDYLDPNFIAAMQKLHEVAPNRAFYFGRTKLLYQGKETLIEQNWDCSSVSKRNVELKDVLLESPVFFPGHLFRVEDALRIGGFRRFSQYSGDWEMWVKLIALRGGVQTANVVAFHRFHDGLERGTTLVAKAGRVLPLTFVQRKRNFALAKKRYPQLNFNRQVIQRDQPVSITFLLRYGCNLSDRLLKYHLSLLSISRSPNWQYRLYKRVVSLFGHQSVRWSSKFANFISRLRCSAKLDKLVSND